MLEHGEFGELKGIVEKYMTMQDIQRILDLPKIRNLVGRVSKRAASRVIMREMIDVARATGKVTRQDDETIDRLMAHFGLEDPYSGQPIEPRRPQRSGCMGGLILVVFLILAVWVVA